MADGIDLELLPDGVSVVDPATGEVGVLLVGDSVPVGAVMAHLVRATELEGYYGALVAEAEDDAIRALLDDSGYRANRERLAEARAIKADAMADLSDLYADRSGRVSIEAGGNRFTWPSPRRTWALAHRSAAYYATEHAVYSLRQTLVRAGVDPEVAGAVLDWLGPTEKVSEPPALQVTIRGEGG